MKSLKPFITTLLFMGAFLLLTINNSFAQPPISDYHHNGYYSFDGLDKYTFDDFITTYKSQLGLTTNDNLIEQECITDENGMTECRYLQYHKGYKVEGSSISLHANKGVVLSAGGNLLSGLDIDVESPISEATALVAALNYVNAPQYWWDDSLREATYKEISEDPNATYYPKGELIISIPQTSNYESENFLLTWKFQVNTIETPNRFLNVYVDALTGNVISSFDRSHYGWYATGDCLTEYDGWQQFRTFHVSVGFNYRLQSDRGYILTTANPGGEVWPKDSDNNWSAWNERPAVTAHWAVEKTFDYFNYRHGRWGSNNGNKVLNYAMQNPNQNYFDFGNFAASRDDNGADVIMSAWRQEDVAPVALDVLAHEYTHRFIAHSSNLNPLHQWIDAGALNEGFADIFGVNAERYTKGASCDWTIGEDITAPFPTPSIRDFTNPNSSTHPQAARYWDGYWDNFTTSSYKYKNAGVLTHWFYLLSEGGTYNGIPVSGIGIEKADDIAFVAMMWWLWGTVDYPSTVHQTLALAEHYYGRCSYEWKQVNLAWRAVGLSGQSNCKNYIIKGYPVVNKNTLDGTVQPYSPSYDITDTESETTSVSSSAITWHIPLDWAGIISEDKLTYTLTNISDDASQEIWVEINHGNDSIDTLRKIVHFVDCEDPNCAEGANKQTLELQKQRNTSSTGINNVWIYPNPIIGNQTTQVVLPYNADNTTLDIFNMQGIHLQTLQLKERHNIIATKELPAGMYLFKIKNRNFQEVHRITINR